MPLEARVRLTTDDILLQSPHPYHFPEIGQLNTSKVPL
jgi:hypothetical protein